MITRERVLELLHYEPETGTLHRKSPIKRAKVGAVAGCLDDKGYRIIGLDRAYYKAHRLVWLIETGKWPVDQLDHINRIKDDNRFTNLREATVGENLQNQSVPRNNKSGYLGVSWDAKAGKWQANIRVKRVKHFLGMFDDPAEASLAYQDAKKRLHTFHPLVT